MSSQLYAVRGHGDGRGGGGEAVSGVMCVVNIFDIDLKNSVVQRYVYSKKETRKTRIGLVAFLPLDSI